MKNTNLFFKIYPIITSEKNKATVKTNKLKIIAPTWNNQFKLPDGFYSVSDI